MIKAVSMAELKSLAARLLPDNSTLRSIILSEPDFLDEREASVKAELFVKLLYRELGLG